MLAALPVPLTVEAAADLWGKIEQATEVLDKMRAHIKEMAARAPIPLPGGKVLAEVTKSRSVVDALKLKSLASPAFYEAVVERVEKVTKTRIEAQLKAQLKPGEWNIVLGIELHLLHGLASLQHGIAQVVGLLHLDGGQAHLFALAHGQCGFAQVLHRRDHTQ